ncbi:universal stress protein [Acetobacter sp. LMG 32666]|uniref:universal stress protein n=1 Tax=Acetobacter sp. LMG 32666 TaxID=2959295 RepID=UPI0030C8B455
MRLLAVLDAPQTAALVLHTADQLAGRLGGGDICALHPSPATNPDFQSPDEGMPDPTQQARFTQATTARAAAVQQVFANWRITAPNAARSQWVQQTGDTRTIVRHAADNADYVVLGPASADATQATRQSFAATLYDAQATVVMAPPTPLPTFAQHPVVAWQDTPNLIRAVHAARPLLHTATHVRILVGEHQPNTVPDPALLADLRASGVAVTLERFVLAGQSVGEQIRTRATQAGADLLVMGAYGRPHFIEWLFGGPTMDLLAHATWPILTHH